MSPVKPSHGSWRRYWCPRAFCQQPPSSWPRLGGSWLPQCPTRPPHVPASTGAGFVFTKQTVFGLGEVKPQIPEAGA